MNTYTDDLESHFRNLLATRETELRTLLDAAGDEDVSGYDSEDYGDAASEEAWAEIEDAQRNQIKLELEQVLDAQHRLAEHRYGACLTCGTSIDLQRLEVMPATPYCTACEAERELSRKAS
jgi:DnaK suppressor protein